MAAIETCNRGMVGASNVRPANRGAILATYTGEYSGLLIRMG
jgi:hypothetical protein